MRIFNRLAIGVAAAYLRNAPFQKGRWRLINHYLPQLRENGSKLGEKVVRTKYHFLFNADLGDWLGQYVYLTGCYEPPTAHVIAALLRPSDNFIDIGANSGFFSLLASKRVGSTGRVLAFEPVPSMRARLQSNLAINNSSNVVIHDLALSDKAGEQLFHEGPPGHKGLSSLRSIGNEDKSFSVRTMPLDKLLEDEISVRLIKIDVEGAEQLVIDGMQRLLMRQTPYLVIEVTDKYLASLGHSAVDLCQGLCKFGYRMYRIESEALIPMNPEDAAEIDQYNALFSREGLPVGLG